MMYISLKLGDLTPTTLAAIIANLSQNIGDGLTSTPDTDRQHMEACLHQLDCLVGTNEQAELLIEYGADPDVAFMATAG